MGTGRTAEHLVRPGFACIAFACTVQALAQLAARPAAEPFQQLTQIDVAATDIKGAPVTDLRPEEVQLREDGKPRPILFFRFAGSKRTMLPHAEGEFFNRPSPPPLVVLLDRWNEKQVAAAGARVALRAALQSLPSLDRVYIYALTYKGELSPIRPMPETDGDLRAEPAPLIAELLARVDAAAGDTEGFRQADRDLLRIPKTYQAIETLASQMASISGRKNLIWVTNGVRMLERETPNTPEFTDWTNVTLGLSEVLARAHIAIYTVQHSISGGSDIFNASWMLSAFTGGRWYGNDSVTPAVESANSDADGGYRIAYDSGVRESDGKEHKIRLDTTRKGVRLLTREGFTFLPGPGPDDAEDAAFRRASRNTRDAAEIGLRAAVSRKPPPDAGTVHFEVRFDPRDVRFEKHGEQYEGRLSVALALYNEDLFKQVLSPRNVAVHLMQAQFDQAAKEGILIPLDEPVGAGISQVRVMVFDRGLQGLGTVTVPLK